MLLLVQRFGGIGILPPDLVLPAIGLIIGLTGLLHLAGGFMIGERIDRWPTGHPLLGLIELVLAVGLLLAPSRPGLVKALGAVWAFLSCAILAFDAWRAYRRWSASAPPAS